MTQELVGAGVCLSVEGYVSYGLNQVSWASYTDRTDSSACWDDCVSTFGSAVVAADIWWGTNVDGGDWGNCYCSTECTCMQDVGDSDITLVVKEGTQLPGACDIEFLYWGSCDWPLDEEACEKKAEEFGMVYKGAGCWNDEAAGCTMDVHPPHHFWFNRHVNEWECGTVGYDCVCHVNAGTTTPSPTPGEVCKGDDDDDDGIIIEGPAVIGVIILHLCCFLCLCGLLREALNCCFGRPNVAPHSRQDCAQSEEGTPQPPGIQMVVPAVVVPMTDPTFAVKGKVVQQPPPADLFLRMRRGVEGSLSREELRGILDRTPTNLNAEHPASGGTLTTWAAEYHRDDLISLLLARGADPLKPSKVENMTALQWATATAASVTTATPDAVARREATIALLSPPATTEGGGPVVVQAIVVESYSRSPPGREDAGRQGPLERRERELFAPI